MYKILSFSLLIQSSFLLAHDQTCKLPKNEVLKIGCTTKCKYFYGRALKKIARKYGYKIEIVDMYKKQIQSDFSDIDGIVIPGGADINPKLYTANVEPDLRARIEQLDSLVDYSTEGEIRDPFERDVLKSYFANSNYKSLPVLGICRGMQMLAVSQGIPLYVDIKEELGIKNRRYLFDRVRLNEGPSLIKSILKYSHFRGYKYHHQGVRVDYFNQFKKERWPKIKLTSFSNSGQIAESMEFENRPILGTQFHPEINFGSQRRRIFGWLLNKSCENKNLKLETVDQISSM